MDATEPEIVSPPGQETYAAAHESDGPGLGRADAERLRPDDRPGGLGRPAGRRARPAGLHSHPLGLCRPAALRRPQLVRRRHLHLVGPAQADLRRPGLLHLRAAVLDDRHRRVLDADQVRGQPHARKPRRVARTQRPLVPVQHLLPDPAGPRPAAAPGNVQPRRGIERDLPVRAQVRPAALRAAALRLFARGRRHAGRGRADAALGPGFSRRSHGARSSPTNTCLARPSSSPR